MPVQSVPTWVLQSEITCLTPEPKPSYGSATDQGLSEGLCCMGRPNTSLCHPGKAAWGHVFL